MRICVTHETRYQYGEPAKGVIQTLRLTPRPHDGQHVVDWRIDVSGDCRLDTHEDAFGNITTAYSIDGPLERLRISVEGEVETQDTSGVVRGTVEPFPPSLFLRETPLTEPGAELAAYARDASTGADTLARMHTLLARVHDDMTLTTDAAAPAVGVAAAFADRTGTSADIAHVFIAAARVTGVPARFINGYVHTGDQTVPARRAWAEAHIAGLGWVAFDPLACLCANDAYVRVAVGLDSLGATPIRGMRYGSGDEDLDVAVKVVQALRQTQS
ncbi:transglutaminase family protein [Xanthobacteraceae bacterium Astr-EGSB]|uniref:transglutaminase family protein n=1 Tax=Astrobacterium formosum TaxID=3069710 RepID=UPI0027B13E9A|nr:transglutaminase family protein [Xanthobacteraceae bacterium Astr-EGSB]